MEQPKIIQWQFIATPERVKNYDLQRKILGFAIYFSIIIYVLILYLNGGVGNLSSTQAYILYAIYGIGLIFWHLILKKLLVFQDKIYTLTNEYIEILTVKNNRKTRYEWNKFSSFSDNPNVYDNKQNIKLNNKSSDKTYYLGKKILKFETAELVLPVNKANTEKVYNFLKNKLPEKNNS